jgi:hypothetical protein
VVTLVTEDWDFANRICETFVREKFDSRSGSRRSLSQASANVALARWARASGGILASWIEPRARSFLKSAFKVLENHPRARSLQTSAGIADPRSDSGFIPQGGYTN